MRTSLIVLIAAQTLTLIAAGYAAWAVYEARDTARDRTHRAAVHVSRAGALEADGRFQSAAAAYTRAARIASEGQDIEVALDLALRSEALALITAPGLPPAAMATRVDALLEALDGRDHDADRVAAAALGSLRARMDGNLTAAAERIEAGEKDGLESLWLDWQMGAIRLRQGRTDDAIQRLEKVAKGRPHFAAGLHRLGLAYLATDRREAAIGALQRAIEAGGETDVSLDLARLFLGQQMWAEAIPHLERVLRGRGGDGEALRLLGAAHFRLGRHDLATRTYKQAFRIDSDPRTLLSAAISASAGGKQGEALAILDTLQPRAAELPEVAWQRGKILFDLGRMGEGRAAMQTYLSVAAGQPNEAERVARTKQMINASMRPVPAAPGGPAPGVPTAPMAPTPPSGPAALPPPVVPADPGGPPPGIVPADPGGPPPGIVPADPGVRPVMPPPAPPR